jgi:hypothetical protein
VSLSEAGDLAQASPAPFEKRLQAELLLVWTKSTHPLVLVELWVWLMELGAFCDVIKGKRLEPAKYPTYNQHLLAK